MSKLPELGINYYTYQFSAADMHALNDPKRVEGLFKDFHGVTQSITTYPFTGQGLTSISISEKGAVKTIHTWPHPAENRFGIVTDLDGSLFHLTTAKRIAETFHPGQLDLAHTPRINHMVARMDIPYDDNLSETTSVIDYLNAFVVDASLNGIPTHTVAREVVHNPEESPFLGKIQMNKSIIAGQVLRNSSIVIRSSFDESNRDSSMSLLIDCMTCEENRDLSWMPKKILDTHSPRRLLIATQQFGPETAHQGVVVKNRRSEVFMRKFVI